MIWYQTLVGPLYRFHDEKTITGSPDEILKKGNELRIEMARKRLLSVLTNDWKCTTQIYKECGYSQPQNAIRMLKNLLDENVVEMVVRSKSTGGRKFLWKLKQDACIAGLH